MNAGWGVAALALILVVNLASGYTIVFDKESYKKGEMITLGGKCSGNEQFGLTMEHRTNTIYSSNIACEEGSYVLGYQTSFLDPAGEWNVRLEGRGGFATARVDVAALPQSAYYLITFLSPISGELRKTEAVKVSVKITDAGVAVENADVLVWGIDGNKQRMAEEGGGIYSLDYEVAYDTGAKSWTILVTAQKSADSEVFGGENMLIATIVAAPLKIDVMQPAQGTFELGERIPLALRITYFNGKELANPAVSMSVGGNELQVSKDANSMFLSEYYAGADELGGITIKVDAQDDAGNAGAAAIKIVTFAGALWFLKANLLYMVIAAVVIAVAAKLAYSRTATALRLNRYKDELYKSQELIKTLQKDYFERGTVPKQFYEKSIAEYKTNIAELGKKIAGIEGKLSGGNKFIKE